MPMTVSNIVVMSSVTHIRAKSADWAESERYRRLLDAFAQCSKEGQDYVLSIAETRAMSENILLTQVN